MHTQNTPYLRHERVSELIRKELGELILRELEFPSKGGSSFGGGGTLVTIVSVDVTKKIDYARTHISVIPSDRANDVLKVLNSNRRMLQSKLLRIINIRPMPELQFVIDHGLEKAAEIEKVFIAEEKRGEIEKPAQND